MHAQRNHGQKNVCSPQIKTTNMGYYKHHYPRKYVSTHAYYKITKNKNCMDVATIKKI